MSEFARSDPTSNDQPDLHAGRHGVNQVTVKLSSTETFTIFNYGGTADVIIDVMGSYGPLTTSTCNGDGGIYLGMLGAGSLTTNTINAGHC